MIPPKKAPYAGTQKDPQTTIADINRMLTKYGITEYQWTTLWSENRVELKMAVEVEKGKRIAIKIVPPTLVSKHATWNAEKGRRETVEAPNWAQSLRLTLWYLKAKVEAIAFGLRDVEEEFLSDIIVRDDRGRETTVGAMIGPALSDGRLDLPALGSGGQ